MVKTAHTGSRVRVLLVADTHIGFDQPQQPRIERRRRGPDFMANFERALEPALSGEVDMVVHSGDLLYRSRVPPALVDAALEPLVRVADAGVPVFVVPGNHERSQLPLTLLSATPRLHIFRSATTYVCGAAGVRVAMAGFPYEPAVRVRFASLVERTRGQRTDADLTLLCLHQAVEGATVGPGNFTFRWGNDVIPGNAVPSGFAAVLAGHIHRRQMLTRTPGGRPLAAPVVYPGSVERTAFAERHEPKGYAVLEFDAAGPPPGRLAKAEFHDLPARPMVVIDAEPRLSDSQDLLMWLHGELTRLPPDAVVQVRVPIAPGALMPQLPSMSDIRSIAPTAMNVTVVPTRRRKGGARKEGAHEPRR